MQFSLRSASVLGLICGILADHPQILAGLEFLGNFGLAHQSLPCNEILLGLDGMIKIGEYCLSNGLSSGGKLLTAWLHVLRPVQNAPRASHMHDISLPSRLWPCC